MSILSVSNLSLQGTLTSALQAEQTTLTELTAQLSSKKKHSDLTDYSASDARNLINLQATASQRDAYLNVINSVNNNLSVYDTTLTDLETIVAQAQSLANNNPTYSASTASTVLTQTNSYLRSVAVDLNQSINGRYIYSGSRYTTVPVQDLTTLPASSLSSTIQTSPSLPSYDSASTLNASLSGQDVTISGTAGTSQSVSATVNGTVYSYTVLTTDTPTDIAAGLAAAITAGGVPTTSSGATLTVAGGNTVASPTVTTTSLSSYTVDKATIDTGYTVTYGISSNDPAFQKLIAGLRYLQAAGNDTTSASYAADIAQASTLLGDALTSIKQLHTSTANNINIMTTEKAAQKTALSSLVDQVSDIQQIDVTQVSAEITSLQTVLQASYSATGSILKLSITSYL